MLIIQQVPANMAQLPASQVCDAGPLQTTRGSDMPAMPAASQHLQSTRDDKRSSCHPAALQEQMWRHLVMHGVTATMYSAQLQKPYCLGKDHTGPELLGFVSSYLSTVSQAHLMPSGQPVAATSPLAGT
jgi:hypothetical protein